VNTALSIVGVVGLLVAYLLAVTKTLGVFRPRPKTVPSGSGPAVSRPPLARASRAQLCWPASWGIKVPLGPVCVYADRLDAPRVGSLPFAHFIIDPSETSLLEIASASSAVRLLVGGQRRTLIVEPALASALIDAHQAYRRT